jgi:hypothetical protein
VPYFILIEKRAYHIRARDTEHAKDVHAEAHPTDAVSAEVFLVRRATKSQMREAEMLSDYREEDC